MLPLSLRPKRPIARVSSPSGPKIPKNLEKVSLFDTFLRLPDPRLFRDFLGILGPEGPETPVNGRLGLNTVPICRESVEVL